MPVVTRRRAAAAAVAAPREVVEEEEGECAAVAIVISSDSDSGSESGSEEEEEDSTSDEDYIDISDNADGAGNEEESEPEPEPEEEKSGVDRGEAACRKIADLLSERRNLDGIKLVECKAYLKKNGLSQTGDMATCVERIMLHWRFKDGDPENIYPRSSFCINCKGDVCRGDAVLFKQKVYEKSGKKHSKCIGKRIVAGKVIKESYGKEKQQHTFTVHVFWSKGVGKLPPLSLLLVKGRNLYRMMTFRQHWPNEVDRLKALEEKHNRGDAARLVRALNRPNAVGNNKKLMQNRKHQSQPGRPDGGASIKEGKKRVMRSSNPDQPAKRSRKEEHQVPSGKKCTGGQRAKTNHAPEARLDKNVCTSSSTSLCKGNMQKDHATLQKNCHMVSLNNGPYSTEVRMNKMKADSQQNHAQFQERYASSGSNMQASHGYFVGIQQPPFEIMRPQGPLPLREVGNTWQAHVDGRSMACPQPRMGSHHPNAALVGWHAPAYSRGTTPSQPGVPFPSFNVPQAMYNPRPGGAYVMPQAMYHPRPGGAYVMPQFRYSGGSNDSR